MLNDVQFGLCIWFILKSLIRISARFQLAHKKLNKNGLNQKCNKHKLWRRFIEIRHTVETFLRFKVVIVCAGHRLENLRKNSIEKNKTKFLNL